MLLKVGLQYENEEERVTRFVSCLKREIQYVVELYEYSNLSKVLHLTLKLESQLKKNQEAKRNTSYNDYYSKSWKGKEGKDERTPFENPQDSTPKANTYRNVHDKTKSSQE